MKTLKIAVAGIGTVGSGLVSLLLKNKKLIEKKIKKKIVLTALASRKKISFSQLSTETLIFKDASDFLNYKNYDILVELIGGEDGIAKEILVDALSSGKSVVTANKALIAKYGLELITLAKKNKSLIGFDAAVAGGIPVIKILNEYLVSNNIKKIFGILNGTSNFILSKMLETNKDFKYILKDAQKLGYAESNPAFDIDGTDTAHKTNILSSLCFGNFENFDSVYIEGIENIQLADIKFAYKLDYKIKLVGITEKKNNKISQFVYPCLINKTSIIANVDNVFNGVVIESDFTNKLFLQGEGAGSFPTATSAMSDIIEISEKIEFNNFNLNYEKKRISNFKILDRFGSYYIRFTTLDQPGVMAAISNEFKKIEISIRTIIQEESLLNKENYATIILTTHDCIEKNMLKAMNKIDSLSFVKSKTVFFRIEEV